MRDADPNATGNDLKKYLGGEKVSLAPDSILRLRESRSFETLDPSSAVR